MEKLKCILLSERSQSEMVTHTIQFQPYNILGKAEAWRWEKIYGSWESGGNEEISGQRTDRAQRTFRTVKLFYWIL